MILRYFTSVESVDHEKKERNQHVVLLYRLSPLFHPRRTLRSTTRSKRRDGNGSRRYPNISGNKGYGYTHVSSEGVVYTSHRGEHKGLCVNLLFILVPFRCHGLQK